MFEEYGHAQTMVVSANFRVGRFGLIRWVVSRKFFGVSRVSFRSRVVEAKVKDMTDMCMDGRLIPRGGYSDIFYTHRLECFWGVKILISIFLGV